MPAPRYLRFARALALCSSLTTVAGCPSSMSGSDAGEDAPVIPSDTPIATDTPVATDAPIATDTPADAPIATDAPADAPVLADAGEPDCTTCDCFGGGDGEVSCFEIGLEECCVAVGPLSPPDLPA